MNLIMVFILNLTFKGTDIKASDKVQNNSPQNYMSHSQERLRIHSGITKHKASISRTVVYYKKSTN